MAKTHVIRQGTDANVSSLTIGGTAILATSIVLGEGEVADLNGEKLVIDADTDTYIQQTGGASGTDDSFGIVVAGAEDFRVTANTLTALSGSTIATNTIAETTSTNGVAVDGLTIKDGGLGAVQAITGDGAITIANYALVILSKAGAGAITLAAPTSGTHDRFEVTVVSSTAQAHVITGGVDGFNAKGSSGTATFGGAIGDSVTFVAHGGHWYTKSLVNVTIA